MTRSSPPPFMSLAPGASSYASLVFPGASESEFPPVDEHVVEPETRQEMIDGRIVYVSPASPPHGDFHTELDFILRAHVAPGYVGATDLLTRTSARWNFAADASIRKRGNDPATGRRYLEEMAFEIMHTQRPGDITARARQLANRGVRRVFLIRVRSRDPEGEELGEVGPVMEWSAAQDRWIELAADTVIEDPCLRCPLPVRALLDAAAADDAVARALLARGNPVLARAEETAEARGYERGRAQSLRQAIAALCQALAIELTPARRASIDTLDAGALQELLDRIAIQHRWDE